MRKNTYTDRSVARSVRDFSEPNTQLAAVDTSGYRSALGKLDGALVEGGTATVSIYQYSNTTSSWVDTGINIVARDFFLGPGEEWPASTRVKIEWDRTTWVVTQAACDPDSGGGGGGGGGGASSQSPGTIGAGGGADMSGQFYPGGTDYGSAFDIYGESFEFDSLLGV